MRFPMPSSLNCTMKKMNLLLTKPLIILSRMKDSIDFDYRILSGEKPDTFVHHAYQWHRVEVEDHLVPVEGRTLDHLAQRKRLVL
mmetsp:Transcript_20372/g.46292  ORF Transcript_20372/g.46292 Transcript_20372/m.46292 type:complete len:85 (-) Transcript_20372:172-426(-)